MAITEVYVDPSIAASSGTGTIGDPYGDVQYALDTQARDSTNGDRFNIKAGTDEILAAALDLTTYGTPTVDARLVLQGYTATQGDGGIGGIDGNGLYSMFASTALDYITLIDMHMHNSGLGNNIIHLDNNIVIINCEIDNGNNGINVDTQNLIMNCYVHNCDSVGIQIAGTSTIWGNTLENGASDFIYGISNAGQTAVIAFNVFSIDGTTVGIRTTNRNTVIIFNSIYSNGGTGDGINATAAADEVSILNNIVEGFSGVGGDGIIIAAGAHAAIYGFNAFYNNTTNLSNSGELVVDLSANDQALGASPFTNAGAGDFTVDTSVQALAYPTANYPNLSVRSYLDIGALQREEAAAGGGLLTHPAMTGGIRG